MSENAPSAPAHSKKRHQPALFAAFGAVFLIVALGAYWWWSPQPEGLMSRPRLDAQSAERLQLERIDQANRALQKDIESLRNTGTGTIDVCPPGTAQRSPQGALMLPEGGPLLPGPAAVTPKSGELRQEPNASTAGPDVVAPTPDAPATASKSADGRPK